MKNKSRLLTTIVALATVAIGLTGCSSDSGADDDTVVFRSAYLPTANYLTTVRTTGVLEDELAKVGATAEHIGPLDPIEAYNTVTSGNADASSTGTGYFVNLAANDSEWVAFALEKYTGDSQGIVAAPGTGIDSLEDLYGKKIGIDNPGATGDYLVHQAFANAGLDVSRVELVSLAPATSPRHSAADRSTPSPRSTRIWPTPSPLRERSCSSPVTDRFLQLVDPHRESRVRHGTSGGAGRGVPRTGPRIPAGTSRSVDHHRCVHGVRCR